MPFHLRDVAFDHVAHACEIHAGVGRRIAAAFDRSAHVEPAVVHDAGEQPDTGIQIDDRRHLVSSQRGGDEVDQRLSAIGSDLEERAGRDLPRRPAAAS